MEDERVGVVEESLVEWAGPFLKDSRRVLRIMDTRLGGQYLKKAVQAVAAVALQCLHDDPKNRPNMVKVLATLEQLQTSRDMALTPPHAKMALTPPHAKMAHPRSMQTNRPHKTPSSA